MNFSIAEQIANLLNDRNQLETQYTAKRILAKLNDFIFEQDENGVVIACVEMHHVQWYQGEVCHLSVLPAYEGKGYGKVMIQKAEAKALVQGFAILQCTIREDNERSKGLFRKLGYIYCATFLNTRTDNEVTVWQKVLSRQAL